jgi:hypothetical protein
MDNDLQELVRSPREDLHIELKEWIDPSDKKVRAKLAKELIALHNHGGGYLVVGFLDGPPVEPDTCRPATLEAFSTDNFNNAIKAFAEPAFHCVVHLVAHPDTGEQYPVIVVPPGVTVPVRCKADSPDGSAQLDKYYIRRPGPESCPPQTAADWDALLNRCILSKKEELLDSLRSILSSGVPLAGLTATRPSDPFEDLMGFRDEAVAALGHLQDALPANAAARWAHGNIVFSARLMGKLKPVNSGSLMGVLQSLHPYTGWPPLSVIAGIRDDTPFESEDGILECWLGRTRPGDISHSDYWRVSTSGCVTLMRGLQEDSLENVSLGSAIEVTLPVWRVAEFMIRVRDLGLQIVDGSFRLQIRVEWHGLAGRELISSNWNYNVGGRARASDFANQIEFDATKIETELASLVAELLAPLYRKFDFFEPNSAFYLSEVRKLLRQVLC